MPFEMITMLGSTVLGGVMSIWSQSIKAIVLLPKLMPVLSPDTSVIVGYLEFKPAFFFLPEKEVMKWITLSSNSLVITPLDTNLVSAIIGLYFGGSLVKK